VHAPDGNNQAGNVLALRQSRPSDPVRPTGARAIGDVSVQIVFETHATTLENERGVAAGWWPGTLSERGRAEAAELGQRRRRDGLAAVFCSDLARASATAAIAFAGSEVPVLADWRLRECDYGRLTGSPAAEVHGRRADYLDTPYPAGESWRQAVERVGWFVADLPLRWAGQRVLVIGHIATRWGLEHRLCAVPMEALAADTSPPWQPGWEYVVSEQPD
jgi:2,3-bisphosphoglycerate-dependent phosphoglycerate mutase